MIFASLTSVRTCQDSEGGDERYCSSPLSNGNSSWRGSFARDRPFMGRALERRLACDSATRRRIGQAFALYAEKRAIGSFKIVNPESDPVVVSKIELGSVAMQMGLGDVKIAAVDPALEDREIIFGGVCVPEIGAYVFLCAVVHRSMPGELPANRPIDRAFVSHQVAGLVHVGGHDRPESLCGYVRDVEATNPTIALDQGQHGGLRWDLAFAVSGLAADESLIALDNLICTAERARTGNAKLSHGLSDAMAKEPRGFQAALESALKLAGADPLFRGAEQVDRLKPHPHRDVAGFEHGADLDGEGLTTGVAFAEADTVGLTSQPADLLAGRAAMRAHWTIRPEPRLNIFVGGFFAVEMSGGKVTQHGLSP